MKRAIQMGFVIVMLGLAFSASGQDSNGNLPKYPRTYPAGDGCNTCTQDTPGGSEHCTLAYCEPKGQIVTPDELLSDYDKRIAALEKRVAELEAWKKSLQCDWNLTSPGATTCVVPKEPKP